MYGLYDDQIKQRIKTDEDGFTQSFAELSSAVMGSLPIDELDASATAKTAIETLLKYYKIPLFEIPDSITGFTPQLEYALRRSGLAKRKVTITTDMNASAQTAVANAIASSSAELVIPPMEFKITATYNGKTVEIDTFSQYVSRSVEITAEQAQKVTTAIIVDPDGTTRHVPTRVYQSGGKWYAEVSSLTNSTYAFVYNEKTFTDAKGKWYEAVVNEMGSRMVINGIGDNLFAGERDITRAEFAAIIVKALGLPTNGNGAVFTDVSRSAWYCGSVGTAYEYGLVSGVGDNKYDPNRAITRQEAMVMIQRAAKLADFNGSNGSIDTFPDADIVSDWALDAAMWNVGSGLIVGSNGKLNPTNNITRAETATLVLKLMQKSELVDVRSPLTAQTAQTPALIEEPRKEPEQVQALDDEEKSDSDML